MGVEVIPIVEKVVVLIQMDGNSDNVLIIGDKGKRSES